MTVISPGVWHILQYLAEGCVVLWLYWLFDPHEGEEDVLPLGGWLLQLLFWPVWLLIGGVWTLWKAEKGLVRLLGWKIPSRRQMARRRREAEALIRQQQSEQRALDRRARHAAELELAEASLDRKLETTNRARLEAALVRRREMIAEDPGYGQLRWHGRNGNEWKSD